MVNGGLDQDRIRQLQAQARGEEPIEATPNTGFHPDQLSGYPLQRIGPKLYSTDVEAVALTETPRDYILVEASEMDDYSHKPVPEPEDFADARAWYSIRDERHDLRSNNMNSSLTRQGKATLRYVDLDEYFDDQAQISQGEYGPNVVLETGTKDTSLQDWRKLLDNSFTTINVLQ